MVPNSTIRVWSLLSENCSNTVVAMSENWQPQVPVEETQGGPIEGGPDGLKNSAGEEHGGARKKIVIVGLGMVGISFM